MDSVLGSRPTENRVAARLAEVDELHYRRWLRRSLSGCTGIRHMTDMMDNGPHG